MCIVIDTCAFSKVFNENNKEHINFAPIYKWIMKRNGKIIIGGAKYAKEVVKNNLNFLSELERMNRIVRLDNKKVDDRAKELKELEPNKKFNDEHIVAMVGISRCCVVCTDEKEANPYLKRRDFYPDGMKPPKVYSAKSHAPLCCQRNIVKACRDD
jgi:rRNA-processing protein FCF1